MEKSLEELSASKLRNLLIEEKGNIESAPLVWGKISAK
jgi:hypothetical protein